MVPQEEFNRHLGAFGSGTVDEIIKDYTEESVVIFPDATYRGIAAIRGVFEQLFAGMFKPGTYEFIVDRMDLQGNVAYIVSHGSTSIGELRMGSDTFVYEDGKIKVHTVAFLLEPK